MTPTADDIADAVSDLAGLLNGEPTAEQLVPIAAQLGRRERAVIALFFTRLAEDERRAGSARGGQRAAHDAVA